jgi:hypothetical protein
MSKKIKNSTILICSECNTENIVEDINDSVICSNCELEVTRENAGGVI